MMSGEIGDGSGEPSKGRAETVEYLQSAAMAVKDMVEQMQDTKMEFEGDMDDTFEQAIAHRGNENRNRPKSAESGIQSSSRESNRGRGRLQRHHGQKRNRPEYFHANRGRSHERLDHSPCNESFDQSQFGHSPHNESFDQSQFGYSPRNQSFDRSQFGYSPRNEGFDRSSWKSQSARNQYTNYRYPRPIGRGNNYQHSSFEPEHSLKNSSGNGKEVSPFQLVIAVAEFPDFRASLLQLMKKRNLNPTVVRQTVSSYSDVFQLNEEIVELRPKIAFCKAHTGSQGCQNQASCNDLHICPLYVTSWCNSQSCVLGHRWFTNHNKSVLQAFYIKEMPVALLRKLVQLVTVTVGPVGQLNICKEYIGKGCSKQDCESLHICQSFVAGRTKCTLTRCQLNHDILNPECSQLLKSHGFSTNETPRDVVVALLSAYPSLSPAASSQNTQNKASNQQNITATKTTTSSSNGAADGENESQVIKAATKTSSSNASAGDEKVSQKTSKTSIRSSKGNQNKVVNVEDKVSDNKPVRKSTPIQTVWSHELQGDTVIAEICYYSVESVCRNESRGCHRLHSTLHYHWQISKEGTNWLNLCKEQVNDLEHAFCDPAQDGVTLSRLDPGKLDQLLKGLLTIMGRDTWKANFYAMILTNSDYSRVVYLRRLSTEAVDGKVIKANIHRWFFKDKNKKWVQYGNVDTAGETNLVSSVTSDDIEKHYLKQKNVPLSFKNASYTYILDFNAMTQKNQNTNVIREVRRRPEPHVKADKNQSSSHGSGSADYSDIPSTWDPMQPEERVRLVVLASSSVEYQSVVNLFNGSRSPSVGLPIFRNPIGHQPHNSNIVKIERVQNPFLWKAFQNKIKEMTTVYGDIKKVDVRQVFHGTNSNVISSICAENFDWRLHGTSAGQAAGRGTYFSPNSATSLGYCKGDASGQRHLFVARVAVGSITQGDASMARPPINPATAAPFDSTGDGVNVIVKYDKQEYYPEYIITIR